MASDLEIAWAAGLIEGEGCFTLHSKYHPYFILDMCDLDTLEKFQGIFPFSNLRGPYTDVRKGHAHYKPRYRVDAFGPKAIEIMKAVFPFMGKRRQEKITELLEIWNNHMEVECDDGN